MTDFDPNATPICDYLAYFPEGQINRVVNLGNARYLERRMHIAEHELENRMAEIVTVRKCWHQAELERERLKSKLSDTEEKLRKILNYLESELHYALRANHEPTATILQDLMQQIEKEQVGKK